MKKRNRIRTEIFSSTGLMSLFEGEEGVGSLTGNRIPHFVDKDLLTLSIPSSPFDGVLGRGSIDRHRRGIRLGAVVRDTG